MKYAALIEKQSGGWQLTFPDVRGGKTISTTANFLLQNIEDKLYVALHDYVKEHHEFPAPQATEGIMVDVPPVDCARLVLLRCLLKLGLTAPGPVANWLAIHEIDAAELLSVDAWVDANQVFRHLRKMGVHCELSFSEPLAESFPNKSAPQRKKVGRPKTKATTS